MSNNLSVGTGALLTVLVNYRYVVKELIDSERKYVDELRFVVEVMCLSVNQVDHVS